MIGRCILAFLIAYVLVMLSMTKVNAENHGYDPADPRTQWMELKKQPDLPDASCCGKWDAYFVDEYEVLPDGTARAHMPAQGGMVYPDGQKKPPVDEQYVIVPFNKVNPPSDDLDNPWDRSVLWATTYEGKVTRVWCFVRHPNGS